MEEFDTAVGGWMSGLDLGDGGVCFVLGPACHVNRAMLRVKDIREAFTAACVATCYDEADSMYRLAYNDCMLVE